MAAGEDTAFAPLIPDLLHLLEGKGHFQVGALTKAHQLCIRSNLYILMMPAKVITPKKGAFVVPTVILLSQMAHTL